MRVEVTLSRVMIKPMTVEVDPDTITLEAFVAQLRAVFDPPASYTLVGDSSTLEVFRTDSELRQALRDGKKIELTRP